MHSPPSPKPHLVDTVTLSAAAVTGAASVLKDTANCLATGGVRAHHSAPKKSAGVDMHLISQQISELAHRVDTLESSMKTDIRTILEILQHQPGVVSRPVPRISSNASQAQQTQPLQQPPVVPERQLTNTYQTTDSEYSSFDVGGPDKQLHHQSSMGTPAPGGHTVKLTPTQQQQQHNKQQRGGGGGGGNVQRSISQPECANERNLFT